MNTFKNLSRVSLKAYPHIKGRIRSIDWGIEDKTREMVAAVAHVYWDSGHMTKCPIDRLNLDSFYPEASYAWEKKSKDEEAHSDPEVDAGKYDA
jgi:hypothetical protein